MDSYLIFRAIHFATMLVMELTLAGLCIVGFLMIPVFASWLLIRPYGEDIQTDMFLCLVLLFVLLKYPYDDIE